MLLAVDDTAKLTNVIVTGFGERCNLFRESKMVVKDEIQGFEPSSRCQVKSCVLWQVGF